jgi:hypothetical protein
MVRLNTGVSDFKAQSFTDEVGSGLWESMGGWSWDPHGHSGLQMLSFLM